MAYFLKFEYVKHEIKRTYLFLISHFDHDPMVVELMKLSALAVFRKDLRAESHGN